MLQLNDIAKRFSETDFSLTEISFHLGKGLHVLIGPNGAGKSTLLRMIAGILPPSAGSVFYNDRDIYTDLLGYKRKMGYMPQTFGMYAHMTGMEFLYYMASLKGLFSRLGRERAEYIAGLLGMRQQCESKISDWSAGMRQRLGLAQALLNDPDILILDEPFCGLDPEETEKIGHLLERLSRKKVLLVSSHITDPLAATTLLFLMNGKLRFTGLPAVFIDEAQGQVWMAEMDKNEWLVLQQRYPGSEVAYVGDSCRCRIVSSNTPSIAGAVAVDPTLEEAYLFWLERFRQTEKERMR